MHNAQKEIVEKIVEIEVVKVRACLLCAALCSCTVRCVLCLLLVSALICVYTWVSQVLRAATHMRYVFFHYFAHHLSTLPLLHPLGGARGHQQGGDGRAGAKG